MIVPEGIRHEKFGAQFKNRKSRCWKAFNCSIFLQVKKKLGLDLAESRSRID